MFDTLAYSKRLQAAGVPQLQADAQAEALAAAVSDQLATKTDLIELKIDLIRWMVGIAITLGAIIIGVMMKLP